MLVICKRRLKGKQCRTYNWIWVVGTGAAYAQTGTGRFGHLVVVFLLKSRRVATQDRLRVIQRSLHFVAILFVPVMSKHEMGVGLYKVRLTSPQFGGKIAGGYKRNSKMSFRVSNECNPIELVVLTVPQLVPVLPSHECTGL